MLKPSEKEFTRNVKNIGTFTFRFPTLIDDIEADNTASRLLGDNINPTMRANKMAVMIGALKVSIVKAPEDFDLDNIYDVNELEAVYNIFIEQVSSFRSKSVFSEPPGIEEEGTQSSEKS